MRDLILQLSKSSIYSTKPFNGTTFTLAALEDWPGGKIDEEPKEE